MLVNIILKQNILDTQIPSLGAVFGGNGETFTGFPGHVCLDNVRERFDVTSTGAHPCTPV